MIFYLQIYLNIKLNRCNNYYILTSHSFILFYVMNNFLRVAYVFQSEFNQDSGYYIPLVIVSIMLLIMIMIIM